MSTPYEKFIAALNLAMHPNTVDADIVAGIRGAYRLLDGKTVKQFLGTDNQTELAEKLTTAETKLKGAVEHSAELHRNLTASEGKLEDAAEFIKAQSIEICRLKTEAAKAVETAVREAARETAKAARPPPKPSPQPPAANNNRLSQNKANWLLAVAVFIIVCVAIIGGLIGAAKSPAATVKQQAAAVRSEEKPKPEPAPTGTMQPTPSGNYVYRSPEFPPGSTLVPSAAKPNPAPSPTSRPPGFCARKCHRMG